MADNQNNTFVKRKHRRCNPKKQVNKLNNIIEEYSLKKNQFYPEQPSPNLFCNRLELRMKVYYETLKRDFKL